MLACIAPASAQARVICGAHRAPTITQSGKVRVYVGKVLDVYGDVGHRTVGCLKGGRRVPLDDPNDHDADTEQSRVRRDSIVIRGRFVAFASDDNYIDDHSTSVEVVDLRSGRSRAGCPSSEGYACAPWSRITDIVLRRNGGTAFVGRRQLVLITSGGGHDTLDTGVDPGSLRLRGRRLIWTKDGRRKTGTLA